MSVNNSTMQIDASKAYVLVPTHLPCGHGSIGNGPGRQRKP